MRHGSGFLGLALVAFAAGGACAEAEGPEPGTAPVVVESVVAGADLTASFTAPMLAPGAFVPDWGDFSPLVVDHECVNASLGSLSASVSFESCNSDLNRVALTGSVTMRLEVAPLHLFIQLDELRFDEHVYGGWIAVFPEDLSAGTFLLEGMLTRGDRGDATQLSLFGVELTLNRYGFALSGDARLETASNDFAVHLDQLAWADGNCMPSGGAISYDAAGNAAASGTAAFYAGSTTDGLVALFRDGVRTDVRMATVCTP